MAKLLPLELMIFIGLTVVGGLLYLLFLSFRAKGKERDGKKPSADNDSDDPEWRAKRFWWFGR
ncbi:MAG TPA: hypothetical protein VK445_09075 [Dissulfurispiraceae bacterium]|nr:hypothetical protein [Dissulfurispiraceae bacterium]